MPPTPAQLDHYAAGKNAELQQIIFYHSEEIQDESSKFQAFAAKIMSVEDVKTSKPDYRKIKPVMPSWHINSQ